MPRLLKIAIAMVRVTEPWEAVFFAVFLLLSAVTLFQSRLGVPRLLAGVVMAVVVVQIAACFFIVDNLRTRVDQRGL